MDEIIQEEILRLIHEEKMRKKIKRFHELGYFTDEEGKRINIGETVNFKFVKKL